LKRSDNPSEQYKNIRRFMDDFDAHYGFRVFSSFDPFKEIIFDDPDDLLHYLRIK